MNITEIKKISIASILASKNIMPSKEKQKDIWYLSPLHTEKTPSFKVDPNKNLWYDHGAGEGGTNIDLVMKLDNVDFKEACQIITDEKHQSFSFSPPATLGTTGDDEEKFTIVAVKTLTNPALIKYMQERKINIDIAKKFVVEIFFQKKSINKNLFAIGFKNDNGGYETRNALYKGNIDGKYITTIKGTGNGKVAVFEGFMDFLSVLTKYKMDEITDDVIVLNSLSMIRGMKEILQDYKEVKYFLDNDKAGREATADLLATVGGKDYSKLYADHKDANDWLLGVT